METLLNIDLELFRWGNQVLIHPILDFLFPLITKEKNALPVYFLALALLLWKGGRTGRIVGITLIITAIVSDQISSNFLKNLVGRLRPCQELVDVRLLINCGSGKSFPSSHAVNNFAAAVILAWHYRKHAWIFITIAAMMAYSRVYCGVHYPIDIFAGTIIGISVAFAILFVKSQLAQKFKFVRIE